MGPSKVRRFVSGSAPRELYYLAAFVSHGRLLCFPRVSCVRVCVIYPLFRLISALLEHFTRNAKVQFTAGAILLSLVVLFSCRARKQVA